MEQQMTEKKVVTTKVASPPIKTEHPQKVYETKKTIFRTYQFIWYILGVIEIILGFRMLLKAIGASSGSLFTSFIYSISEPLAFPFRGIIPTIVSGKAVFEWSLLIAIAVYALVAYGLIEFFQLVKPVKPEEVEDAVDNP